MTVIGVNYWDNFESMSINDLKAFQGQQLFKALENAYCNSSFYRDLYDGNGVNLRAIKSLANISEIPFVYPKDLMANSKGLISSPSIVTLHSSGGTTKKPKTVYRTYSDFQISSDVMARLFFMNGIRGNDIVAILQPFGVWAIGSLALEGLRTIGSMVIPLGIHMSDETVIEFLEKHLVSAMFITPSNCIRIGKIIQKMGGDPKNDFTVKRAILAGEKVSAKHRETILDLWGAETFSLYGSEETDGLATECVFHNGLHFCADKFYLEIIDPDTEKILEIGELGEAVITTLTMEGTPLIRYRIGDLIRVVPEGCECGRKLPLIDVKGRASEVLILTEGTKIYPYQIEAVIDELDFKTYNYQLVRSKKSNDTDMLTFYLEIDPNRIDSALNQKVKSSLERLSIDFIDAFNASLVELEVNLLSPNTLEPTKRGKMIRFVDKSKMGDD